MVNKPSTNFYSDLNNMSSYPGQKLVLGKYLNILKKYNAPKGIIGHSLGVYSVSKYLVERLEARGFHVDKEAVFGAAILHDIDKVSEKEHIPHGVRVKGLLKKENIKESIIRIIENHPGDVILKKDFSHLPTEDKIVFYSDKIFEQKICSIKDRLLEWQRRSNINIPQYNQLLRKIKKLESELLKEADLTFEDIKLFFSKN